MRRLIAAWLALATGLAACVPVPPRTGEPALKQSTPTLSDADLAVAGAVWPEAAWWRRYGDPTLDSLVERALAGAPGLATAMARVDQAQANLKEVDLASGIKWDANASLSRQRLSENGFFPTDLLGITWYNQADLSVQGSYRFDWWGKQRLTLRSARNSARATLLESAAARLTVAASVTDAYFGWQADQARLALAQHRIDLLAQEHSITQQRLDAGLARADELQQVQVQEAAAQEALSLLKVSADMRRVVLAALIGIAPDELPALTAHPLPAVRAAVPAGVSLDLAAHRPDVQAAYWSVRSAVDNLDAVRAGYYPDLSLHALAGLSSIHLGKLFEIASADPNFGAAIHLPIFDLAQLRADRATGQARLGGAIAAYNSAVVDAARELNSVALTREQLQQQLTARLASQDLARQQYARATARGQAELSDAQPELSAARQQVDADDAVLTIDAALLANDINLTRALGGGYGTRTEASP